MLKICSWYDKITTPPALYILAVFGFCGRERYLNSFLIPFFYVGGIRFRKLFAKEEFQTTALIALLLPVLFHSSLLFYTDLFSITVLLWGFTSPSPTYASLIFLIAVLTRQTNIIWAGLYGAVMLFKEIDTKNLSHSLLKAVVKFWALELLAASFILFFILNNFSVVLGDRQAHKPQPHFMQIYYLLVYTCFSAAPLLCLSGCVRMACKDFLKQPLLSLVFCLIIMASVFFFTFEHIYLLSDNRHLTFYVWRRWFKRHWLCRYFVVPCYLLAAFVIKHSIAHIKRYVIVLFLLSTVVVLVPASLLEPRYFITPFVLWRLSVRCGTRTVLFMEMIYSCIINIFVLYLFFEKPFRWSSEPGMLQRIMW